MSEPTCWLCSVCCRSWVEGYGPGLHTAPECHHGGEVRLPVRLRDEADALRWLAGRRKLEAGSFNPPDRGMSPGRGLS